jgi:hypothetical protein
LGAGGAIEVLLLGVVVVVTAPAAPCADGVVELVEDEFTFGIALCPTATVVTGAFTTMSSAGATVVVAERTVVVVTAVVVVAAG